MENFNSPQPYDPFYGQRDLPNATMVLVLGILSIAMACCFSPVGLVLAIVAMNFNNKDLALYNVNPESYTRSSFSNLNAGKICAIIGLILSILGILFLIAYVAILVFAVGNIPDQPWSDSGGF